MRSSIMTNDDDDDDDADTQKPGKPSNLSNPSSPSNPSNPSYSPRTLPLLPLDHRQRPRQSPNLLEPILTTPTDQNPTLPDPLHIARRRRTRRLAYPTSHLGHVFRPIPIPTRARYDIGR